MRPNVNQNRAPLTKSRCLPVIPLTHGLLGPKNISALRPSAFNVCEPTNGTTEVIEVDPARGWVGLNFYSPAAISNYAISIDQHQMYVYAIDGNFIEPQPEYGNNRTGY